MNSGTRITGQLGQPTTSLHTWPITWDIKGCLCLFKHHSLRHTPDCWNCMKKCIWMHKKICNINWNVKCFSMLNISQVILVRTDSNLCRKEVPGIRSALGRPMTHLKDTTPPTDHPHPWHPRMRKRDLHARLLTNAAFRWSLDPHPHQTETFPVHTGAIYSQRPTWTFPLSVNYVSEKTTQQLHARVETVYAITVIREGTSPEHVSYRTRGLAASPLQRESSMNILGDHGEEDVSPACRHESDGAENIIAVHEGTDLYSNATACRVDDDVYNLCPELFDFRSRLKFNFIFTHINLNSFRYKYSFIRDILIKQSVDYFAISESKLDDSFTNAQFHIPDFVCYRQDLTTSNGGLLIYVRADFPHRRLNHIEINYNGFESLCTKITIGNTKTVLCCVYKHSKVSNDFFKQCMSKLGDAILQTYDDFVFLGDMNCCPSKSNVIKDLCDLYDLKNVIKDPTCHKGATPTLLDNILVSNHRRYTGALNANFNLSGCHNLMGAATRRFAPIMKPRKIFYHSYKHFCEADYLTDLSFAPFHVADIFDDIDDI